MSPFSCHLRNVPSVKPLRVNPLVHLGYQLLAGEAEEGRVDVELLHAPTVRSSPLVGSPTGHLRSISPMFATAAPSILEIVPSRRIEGWVKSYAASMGFADLEHRWRRPGHVVVESRSCTLGSSSPLPSLPASYPAIAPPEGEN